MALGTYGELKTSVLSWLDRDDDATTAAVGDFIRYAHDEIVRAMRLPLVRKVVTATLDAERPSLPTDILAVRALTINDTFGGELTATSPGLRATHANMWPVGRPQEYSIEAGAIALAPIPDAGYAVTLVYDASPLLMSDDDDTNVVFAKTPFLYVTGALSAGFAFNQFTEQATLYEAQFRRMLGDVQRQGLADAMSGPIQIRPSMGFTP